jgi:hypothetical protein
LFTALSFQLDCRQIEDFLAFHAEQSQTSFGGYSMFPRFQYFLMSLILVLPAKLYAGDYTYQQTTQMTGGSLLHMIKSVGVFSSQARQFGAPVVSSIYLKGNRLANVSPDSIQIIDLDAETVTHIDIQKKTYTVTTFAQMKQAIENARAQMQQEAAKQQPQPAQPAADPNAQNVKMSFDAKVRNTGVQKEVSGLVSNEAILTLTLKATDTQSQQSGSMAITNDMWMVPSIPGYEQVRDFYMRFAAKMADSTIGLGYDFKKALAQTPAAGLAIDDMASEMQKLKGVPIMQVMRVGTTVNGQPLPAASEAPLPADASPASPSAGQVAKNAMGSMFSSHFGGFGNKKNDTSDQDSNQNTNGGAQAQPTSSILMETQIITSNFSSAPVDPAHFEIPAGYKQLQTQQP